MAQTKQGTMTAEEFAQARQSLPGKIGATQKLFGGYLGRGVQAVFSYENGQQEPPGIIALLVRVLLVVSRAGLFEQVFPLLRTGRFESGVTAYNVAQCLKLLHDSGDGIALAEASRICADLKEESGECLLASMLAGSLVLLFDAAGIDTGAEL